MKFNTATIVNACATHDCPVSESMGLQISPPTIIL